MNKSISVKSFTETYVYETSNVTYSIYRHGPCFPYHWDVTVRGMLMDEFCRHERCSYKNYDGDEVVGFHTLDDAVTHMRCYAKDPDEYLEDYIEMLRG